MKTPEQIAADVLGDDRRWPTPFRTGSDLIDSEIRGLIVQAIEADRAQQRIPEQVAREFIGADALAGIGYEHDLEIAIKAIEYDREQR